MKSIYNQDDLRCNEAGLLLKVEADTWFKSMLEKYSDYNPREMAELFTGEFSLMVSRRILELRRSGILKEYGHMSGQVCPPGIDCDAVRCQNYRYYLEDKK